MDNNKRLNSGCVCNGSIRKNWEEVYPIRVIVSFYRRGLLGFDRCTAPRSLALGYFLIERRHVPQRDHHVFKGLQKMLDVFFVIVLAEGHH